MCVCVWYLAVMVLPSSRLIKWEGLMSLFALVNERKEGESIQYRHSINTGTLSSVCVCVCVCVSAVKRDRLKPHVLPQAN